jgi:hypothetical protein
MAPGAPSLNQVMKKVTYGIKHQADPGRDDPFMFRVVFDDDGGKSSLHMRVGGQIIRFCQVARIENSSAAYAPGTNRVDDGAVRRARALAVEADEQVILAADLERGLQGFVRTRNASIFPKLAADDFVRVIDLLVLRVWILG